MKRKLLVWVWLVFLGILNAQVHKDSPNKNISSDSPINKRVATLLKRMTLDEKIGQRTQFAFYGSTATGAVVDSNTIIHIRRGEVGSLLNADNFEVIRNLQKEAVNNSRLGIPILFGMDVIHGFRTIFPIPLAQSASWDLALIEKCESIAAMESSASGINWTFAPMVDISRDPRWGRVLEGAGEDPYLGSEIAKARVKGFQGDKIGSANSVLACIKHFAAYGTVEAGREYNTTDMSLQNLFNFYLPPYKAAVDANAATLMTAFNELNGVPCSASKYLLTDILRNRWNFKGMVVTDYTAIPEMLYHGNVKNEEEAAIASLNAGVDMDMQGSVFLKNLKQAYLGKKVTLKNIEEAASRILKLKIMIGLFDNPYRFLNEENLRNNTERPEFDATALEMARKSIVLLKNNQNILPLSLEKKYTIAMIGPYSADKTGLNGEWSLSANKTHDVSPYWAITKKIEGNSVKIIRSLGCTINGTDTAGYADARRIAQQADIVLLMMGENENMSGEAHSRTSITIPDVQRNLMKVLKRIGKPMVLILTNGRPLDLSWEDANLDAILETWFLGRKSGDAMADILFGDYNPSGKLTMTFPRTIGQVPIYYNHKNTGRPYSLATSTERYHSVYIDVPNTPLYPFGYGLSYTNYKITDVRLNKKILNQREVLKVTAKVTNSGKIDGENTVQLYIQDLVNIPTRPVKELKAFGKFLIRKGETIKVEFSIPVTEFSFYDDKTNLIPPIGEFKLWVANSSDDNSKEVNFAVVK